MDFKVLAIDPGGTTGFCTGVLEGKTLTLRPWQAKLPPDEFHREITSQFANSKGLFWNYYCVCESFEYRKRARPGLDLTPAHLIGLIKAHVPSSKLRFQSPAQGKGFWSNAKLNSIGAYLPITYYDHAMDATRHLLQWYKFGFGSQFYTPNTDVVLIKDRSR